MWAQTPVTGQVKYADGTPFTGIVRIALPRPAADQTSGFFFNVPTQYTVRVNGGYFAASMYATQQYTSVSRFLGTGLNDLTTAAVGAMVLLPATQEMVFCAKVDSTGGVDTFSWGTTTALISASLPYSAASCTNGGTLISMVAGVNVPGFGIGLLWGSTTGHTLGNAWGFRVRQALAPQEVYSSAWYVGNNTLVAQFNLSIGALAMDVSLVNLAVASAVWH